MSKNFAPRVSKKDRKVISFDEKLFRFSDSKLLEGAKLAELKLKNIQVKDQVRTKFNDDSIRELAANIKANGLIQPLVVHFSNGVHTLICGERRFRAMSSIQQESAPCFIIENKSEEELMAIQFSENSSREELHYIDKAEGVYNYYLTTKASERKIVEALGISKSEVHRGLMIAKLSRDVKEAAKKHDVEKYVLLEYEALPPGPIKRKIEDRIIKGEITKRIDLKKVLKEESKNETRLPRNVTANSFIKMMEEKTKDLELDPETIKLIKGLMSEAKDGLEDIT